MLMTEIDKVLTFFRGLDSRDPDLASRDLNTARYVQHTASKTNGFPELEDQIRHYSKTDHGARVIRNFQDGLHVFTQREGNILGQKVFFDVFRFEDGAVVERWAFSDKDAPPNLSGHTQNDGPVEAAADEDTGKNKSLIREYYEIVHIIPTALDIDRCPGAGTYGADSAWIAHQPVPSGFTSIDNVVVAVPDG